MTNLSLKTGFIEGLKDVYIPPLLKKPNLDKDELKNYSRVSNLKFVSKLIELVFNR